VNISIFGLGYVGCVSSGCLAECGHNIIAIDKDVTKVDFINEGKATIIENQVDRLIAEQFKAGRLSAVTDGRKAVLETDISIICVGTPSTDTGHLDMSAIHNVAEDIGYAVKEKSRFHIVLIRSTVPPGTNRDVSAIIEKRSEKQAGEDFAVVSNPEFLREGTAYNDFHNPAYTLLGTANPKAISILREMYKDIPAPCIVSSIYSAEIIKYINNSFHALKITFANEVGNICKKLGVDSHEVMDLFCKDEKLNISSQYLKPGFSYGGSCLPKDLKALRTIAHDHYLECPVIENIERSNERQKQVVLDRLVGLGKNRVGFIGISFKSGTDDLRNSPIIDIIERLLGKGFEISIYDKHVQISKLMGANKEFILRRIPYISRFIVDDVETLIKSSDVIVVVNKEDELTEQVQNIDNDKHILDLVNIADLRSSRFENYDGMSW